MELRHLKYFLAVAEELHFSKAAEKLFIVQPALSRQIKELEGELGILLFKRTKRVVSLTEAGKFYYSEAKNIFLSLEQMKRKAKEIETGSIGKIKIGYVGSAMQSVLPKLILRLQKEYPGLHFELYEVTAKNQIEMLKTGKIDIGFLRIPGDDKELVFETIYTESYSLVLPFKHKKNVKNFKGLHEFASENFIIQPRNTGERYFDNIISLCNSAGFSPIITHESLNEDATIRLVENNLGISIFPTSFTNAFKARVKYIELKNTRNKLQLSIAWNNNNTNSTLQTFIKIIRDFTQK
jgi:DNA-binding transcriptional LysR family regulator